jgi:hypothetical protein
MFILASDAAVRGVSAGARQQAPAPLAMCGEGTLRKRPAATWVAPLAARARQLGAGNALKCGNFRAAR